MNSLFFSLAVVLAFALPASAQTAAVGPGAIKIGKVMPSVQKTPEFSLKQGDTKRFVNKDWLEIEVSFESAPEVIDELTFKYTVLMDKKLLDGEVTHSNILKGKDHFSVMYMSPNSISRLTGGKPMTANSIENVWVEISRAGQVLAKESFKQGVMPNAPHTAGLLVNKDQTPFAPLYFDRYEMIKPSTR